MDALMNLPTSLYAGVTDMIWPKRIEHTHPRLILTVQNIHGNE